MKNSLKFALVAALVSLGCDSKQTLNRDHKDYQVVQEGSSAGVSSTVGAPGEASLTQTPPITGTNADTTTSFTIAGGVPPQVGTSTAPLMPPPNVGAGGAAMPNYPIPPGLARNIGGGSTTARRTSPRETTTHAPATETQQPPMTSAEVAPVATENTASALPASTEPATPHKSDEKKAAPAPEPAPAENSAPAEEPANENPPATQTGTFGPR